MAEFSFRINTYLYTSIITLSALTLASCGGGSSEPENQADDNNGAPVVVTDTTPEPFTFATLSAAKLSTLVESEEITISGINTSVTISIDNGEYSVNSQSYTNVASTVNNGDKVKLRLLTPSDFSAEVSSNLSVGQYTASFITQTIAKPEGYAGPEVKISFPLSAATTKDTTLKASGTVEDSAEVLEVYVNDELAQITTTRENGKDIVNWSSNVTPNEFGNYKISVSSTNNLGYQSSEVAQSELFVPLEFHVFDLDPLTGDLYAIKDSVLYRINVEAQSIVQLSEKREAFAGHDLFYDPQNKRITTLNTAGNNIEIYQITINSDDSFIIEKLLSDSTIYATNEIFTSVGYSAERNKLALGFLTIDSDIDKVVEFNMSDKTLSTSYLGSDLGTPYELAYTQDFLVYASGNNLHLLNVEDKSLVVTRVIPNSDIAITATDEPNEVYIVDFNSVYRMNLASAFTEYLIEKPQDSLDLMSNLRQVEFDQSRGQLIIREDTTIGLSSFNLNTNQFSKYYTMGRGEGPKIVTPRAMDITRDGKSIYVFDDGGNVTPAIFKIDVDTGNRELVTTFTPTFYSDGIELNEAENTLYLLTNNRIYKLDLNSKQISEFHNLDTVGEVYIESITSMVLSPDNTTLYAIDLVGAKLFKINIQSNTRTLVTNLVHNGGNISAVTDLAFNSVNEQLYFVNQAGGEVYEYSMETGVLKVLLNYCEGVYGDNMLNEEASITDIFYDPNNDSLYIQALNPLRYDFATSKCHHSGGTNYWPNLDLLTDSEGRLFSSFFGQVRQLDFTNGSSVTISQY